MSRIVLKPIRQSSGLSGPAALSSLLQYYGVKMSERELARLCGSSKSYGTEPEMLLEALKKLGFKAVARKGGTTTLLRKLVTHGTPVLVSLEHKGAGNKYVLVYEINESGVLLMDPELGAVRRLGEKRFLSEWKAVTLTGKELPSWYLYIAI